MDPDFSSIKTPCFIYDLDRVNARLQRLRSLAGNTPLKILYSMKSASFAPMLSAMAPSLDGIASSSLFESRLAREVLGEEGNVHLSTVVLLDEHLQELLACCDYININSVSQLQRLRKKLDGRVQYGLRVNPQTNFVADPRYDPCRDNSKLGVPVGDLIRIHSADPDVFSGISGLQFHNNCESRDLVEMLVTCEGLLEACRDLLHRLEWINIGGGYLFDEDSDMQGLVDTVQLINDAGIGQVFFEPGKAIVGDAGYLVTSVVDMFNSDGKEIAILDCSVNHLPEVFEFQYQPQILPRVNGGVHEYRLSGMTCLSGDLFGDYRFDQPLRLGDRIIFRNVGAYMFVKASMFNGINLPPVYLNTTESGLSLIKEHTFEDYKLRLS
ncbi:MAG: hypothetical protein MI673_05750 [Thiotrichales bacterium]|nr:hypothetical protein [Thiotrichales bacterium]